MNSVNHEINSEALMYYRKNRGYSQEDLAGKIGVKPNTISRWEVGKTNVRQTHQTQLKIALGVSLEQLREAVPAHKLRALKNLDPRTYSTISETTKISLDIVSETYHVNRDAIMDIAPFLFHVVAAASLGRRATKLDEMDKELEKVMEICKEKLPYIPGGIFIEGSREGGGLHFEQEAINDNRLFFSYEIARDINDISTNPFSQFLKSFIDMTPEKLNGLFDIEWRNDELPKYHITESFIRDSLRVPVGEDLFEEIMELLLNGNMQLKEINYREFLGGFDNEFIENHKEEIINEIKKKVLEKQASHKASKQFVTGESR